MLKGERSGDGVPCVKRLGGLHGVVDAVEGVAVGGGAGGVARVEFFEATVSEEEVVWNKRIFGEGGSESRVAGGRVGTKGIFDKIGEAVLVGVAERGGVTEAVSAEPKLVALRGLHGDGDLIGKAGGESFELENVVAGLIKGDGGSGGGVV